jgi:hypothetical protein
MTPKNINSVIDTIKSTVLSEKKLTMFKVTSLN